MDQPLREAKCRGLPTERVEMSTAWFLTTERGREKREKKTGERGGGGGVHGEGWKREEGEGEGGDRGYMGGRKREETFTKTTTSACTGYSRLWARLIFSFTLITCLLVPVPLWLENRISM